MDNLSIAFFRKMDRTYTVRGADGSHETRYYYEVRSDGIATVFTAEVQPNT